MIRKILTKLKRPKVYIPTAIILIALIAFWFCLPKPLFNSPTSYVIDDEKGELLGAAIAADGQWRFPYDGEVPEKFKQCIIAFEDKRFLHHPGVDALAFGRAIRQNIKSKRVRLPSFLG